VGVGLQGKKPEKIMSRARAYPIVGGGVSSKREGVAKGSAQNYLEKGKGILLRRGS